MDCHVCGAALPDERAEFLTEAGKPLVCINCTTECHRLTLMDYSHKTAPVLVVIGGDREQVRMAQRAYRRAR